MSAQLGRALAAAWAGGRKAPPATSWSTQLNELTRTGRGRQALANQGITPRSIMAWLADERDPTAKSRDKISDAYRDWFSTRRGATPLPTTRTHVIYGNVKIGDDSRDRRNGLRIDGRDGDWSDVKDQWNGGAPKDYAKLADAFIRDVVMGHLDGISDESMPEFDGATYTVEVL